ncbi:MAG: hypothetical protein KME16_18370 [Scytolyngbya sp. HA4215-MV1]|nr:hypothetical protein [Scytolyngbya sp. HA4215-MV1]
MVRPFWSLDLGFWQPHPMGIPAIHLPGCPLKSLSHLCKAYVLNLNRYRTADTARMQALEGRS